MKHFKESEKDYLQGCKVDHLGQCPINQHLNLSLGPFGQAQLDLSLSLIQALCTRSLRGSFQKCYLQEPEPLQEE